MCFDEPYPVCRELPQKLQIRRTCSHLTKLGRSFRKTLTKFLKLAGVSSWKGAGCEVLDLVKVVAKFFFASGMFEALPNRVGNMRPSISMFGYVRVRHVTCLSIEMGQQILFLNFSDLDHKSPDSDDILYRSRKSM